MRRYTPRAVLLAATAVTLPHATSPERSLVRFSSSSSSPSTASSSPTSSSAPAAPQPPSTTPTTPPIPTGTPNAQKTPERQSQLSPEELKTAIQAATNNLRAAMRAWAEVEQLKATAAAVVETQAQRDGGRRLSSPTLNETNTATNSCSSNSSSTLTSGDGAGKKNKAPRPVVDASGTAAAQSTASESIPRLEGEEEGESTTRSAGPQQQEEAQGRTAPTTQPPSDALWHDADGEIADEEEEESLDWIRNKKLKFWDGIVYTSASIAATSDELTEQHASSPSSTAKTPSRSASSSSLQLTTAQKGGADTPTTTAATPNATASSEMEGKAHHSGTSDNSAASTSPLPQSSSCSSSPPTTTTPSTAATAAATTTAASVRLQQTRDPVKPFRNRYKRDVARQLSALLDCDPELGPALLGQLSAESRRLLLVMGTASEYFGANYAELAAEVKAADTDKDKNISGSEFDQWAMQSFKKRHTKNVRSAAAAAATDSGDSGDTAKTRSEGTGTNSIPAAATGGGGLGETGSEKSVGDSQSRQVVSSAAAAFLPSSSSFATTASAIAHASGSETSTPPSSSPSSSSAAAKKPNPILKAIQQHPDVAPSPSSSSAAPDVGTASSSATAGRLTQSEDKSQTSAPSSASAPSFTAAAASERQTQPSSDNTTPQQQLQERKEKAADPSYIPWPTYRKLIIAAAAPFLAFGILDNSTLVLAGDAVDRLVSESMGLSEMATAAVGGVVSGVAGIQVHGLAERWTRSTPPILTAQQHRSCAYMHSERIGSTLGMVVGLVIGMTPLLFVSNGSSVEEDVAEDNALLQQAADRIRASRRQRSEVVRGEAKERGLIEFEERETTKRIAKQFAEKPEEAAA